MSKAKQLTKLRSFLGRKVTGLFALDFSLGIIWFVIEAGFLFVFQGFLLAVGIVELQTLKVPSWYPTDLVSNLVILVSYGFFRAVLTSLKKTIPTYAAQCFMAEQRERIMRHSFYSDSPKTTAEIVGAFGELVTKAGNFALYCSTSLASAVLIILLAALAIRLAPYEAFLSFALLAAIMWPVRFFNKRIRRYGEALVRDWGVANKVLVEGLRNIFLLKLYHLVETEFERGTERIRGYRDQYSKYYSLSAFIGSVPIFFGLVVIALVTFVSRTHLKTDAINYVAFLYVFLRLSQNASVMSGALTNAYFYYGSFTELYRWCDEYVNASESKARLQATTKLVDPVIVDVQSLSFRYPTGPAVISGLDLKLKSGGFLLVKGASGSGKSTFIKLLAGMVQPNAGTVQINGQSPDEFLTLNADVVGYVGPEPFMVPGTVRENLLYGRTTNGLSDARMWEVLEEFGMSRVIREMPGQLDAQLKEETQLSTGQKQRLAFARAVLRDPRLLVLDEATANIDYRTENLIVDFLRRSKGKITVVAISHRESFDGLADLQINMGGV